MQKFFAGIGSRKTPPDLIPTIDKLVMDLDTYGYALRSGAADGADTFFENKANPNTKEIFLPWKGFNGHDSMLYNSLPRAMRIAEKFHPNFSMLNEAGRLLMARNAHQVLGRNLDDPVAFVVCWTPDAKLKGGTALAIRLAKSLSIPVYNLARPGDHKKLLSDIFVTPLW